MKKIIRIVGSIIIVFAVLTFLALSRFYTVPILMYHYIDYHKNSITVSPENFRKQMDFLHKNNYNLISLDELVEGIKLRKTFARKSAVITFDDGYEDNFIYAFPILKEYNFPATIFLVSGFIEKEKDFLNWQEIKQMQKQGILFGAHGKDHKYLPGISDDRDLIEQIEGSKIEIESKLGTKVNHFCYITGGFNNKIKDIVKIAGYKSACTTNRGQDRLNRDVFELNRIKMTNASDSLTLWFKLSGYYNLFRSLKSPN